MTVKSTLEYLARSIVAQLPNAAVQIDKPRSAKGTWFLDVTYRDQVVVVQWQEDGGFGISCTGYHGYGEAADETYSNVDAARFRILSLLLSNSHTSRAVPMRLFDLRKSCGVSQIELAQLLSIQQGAVSRLERRADLKISTVRDYVRKLGGELKLMAAFPDGGCKIVQLDEDCSSDLKGDGQ